MSPVTSTRYCPTPLAAVESAAKTKAPEVAVARLSPFLKPVTVAAKAGLAAPYSRDAAVAATVKVAGVMERRPSIRPVKT